MSLRNNTSPNYGGVQLNYVIKGLDAFVNVLEKDFFAQIDVQTHHCPKRKTTELVLDIHCNFGITESLHYFNNGNWGGFQFDENGNLTHTSFLFNFNLLNYQNKNTLDIMETSFHFKDTSVIISRLNPHSIPTQIGNIMTKISEHFVHLTKGLTAMPFEIFIAVLEEKKVNFFDAEDPQESYFNYWGLYFEDCKEHCVMVYNLAQKKLTRENLFLLE
ncbi:MULTISPECIES: hypothetical protein [Flavobacteriaceae]|uniref:hypothetical protein n=1 Tax=Flavobacteriaceae TaxID=49546 RepID=UPI0014930755|nr:MULTISPECIES: hypothetical protein [Allomuricauda]MDC6364932.1 hypothetical protein [Muricauda sp. AC10]